MSSSSISKKTSDLGVVAAWSIRRKVNNRNHERNVLVQISRKVMSGRQDPPRLERRSKSTSDMGLLQWRDHLEKNKKENQLTLLIRRLGKRPNEIRNGVHHGCVN